MAKVVKAPEEFLVILGELVQKNVNALTEADKAFIRARSSYLTGDQVKKFESILPKVVTKK